MKLYFTDLDGTLISHTGWLHEDNPKAIARLHEKGYKVALCTGRNNIDLLPTLKQYPIDFDYLVLCNGAYITDKDFNVLYEKDIPVEIGREMIAEFAKQPLFTYYCDEKEVYMSDGNRLVHIDGKGDVVETKDCSIFLEKGLKASKYTIIGINQPDEKTDFIVPYLNEVMPRWQDDISYFYNRVYVDIMASGSNKGSGLLKLAELLNVPVEDTVAIGDSFNDESMLQVAGTSFTFDYAPDSLQKQVDHVIAYLKDSVDYL